MRSMLFVPADSERKINKGLGSGADALILDLEDSIAAANRPAGRALTREVIASHGASGDGPALWVRINPLDSGDWEADLDGVMAAGPAGIVLPKPRSGEDVHRLSVTLDHEEARHGHERGRTRILAIVTETPISVLQLSSYVDCSSRMVAMTWGAEDLGAVVGSLANRGGDGRVTSPYRLVRDLSLITAAAAGVEPIDTVYVDFRHGAGLEAESQEAKRDGFTGKMAIHPDQVAIINAVFTPSADEVARARAVLAAFDTAGNAGVASLDGQMLDRPHQKLAERVLTRASTAGIG